MKNNLTKSGFSIIELIASILISSVILIGFYGITSDALLVLQTKKESVYISNQLFSLKLFIQNRILGSKVIQFSQHSVDFFELDHIAMEGQFYNGFAELDDNQTSKSQIKTKCSNYLPAYGIYILFSQSAYEIESINIDKIILKDKTTPKKFSENYTICKKSKFEFDGLRLKYDSQIILENIKNLSFSQNGNMINLDFCADFEGSSICRNWDFVI